MMRFLFVAFFSALLGTKTLAKVDFIDVYEIETWEEMLQLAATHNKSIFVYYKDFNCGNCKTLKKTTLKNRELSKAVSADYLALRIYSYSNIGVALQKLFGLSESNYFMALNTKEILFYKKPGYISANDLLVDLNSAKEKIALYRIWQKGAFEGTLEKEEWLQFLLIERLNNRVEADASIVRDISSMIDSSDFHTKLGKEFIGMLAVDVDNPVFQTLKQKPNWLAPDSVLSWETYFNNVYDFNMGKAIYSKDSIFMEDVLFQISGLPPVSSIENMQRKGRQLYLAETENWNAFDTLTKTYLFALPADSANVYQQEALHLLNYYSDSYRAKNLALDYLRLGLKQKETFELYYTLGIALYQTNDDANAFKAMKYAFNLAKNNEEKRMAAQALEDISQNY